MKKLVMPPVDFSNAMNFISPGWDFTNWESSNEWKIFNAGRASTARDMEQDSKQKFNEYQKVARQ